MRRISQEIDSKMTVILVMITIKTAWINVETQGNKQ